MLDSVDAHDWDASKDALEKLSRKYSAGLLKLAYEEAGDTLPGISFDLRNPLVQKTIAGLATRIRDVADTTRDDVRRWVEIGTEEGLSVQKIAEQLRSKAADISPSRALTIARTETATAHSLGSLLYYEEAGIKDVEVLDGDDDEECATADGQIWTLEEARENPIAHPNCTRSFLAVVD